MTHEIASLSTNPTPAENIQEALITLLFFTLSLDPNSGVSYPPAGTVIVPDRTSFGPCLSFARVTAFMSVPDLPGSIDVSVIISIVSCAKLACLPTSEVLGYVICPDKPIYYQS